MSAPLNQPYAISDTWIAIAKNDDLNVPSMIYIYPMTNATSDDVKQDTTPAKPAKKLRYSAQMMDTTYSSRFISLSKDGQYLAISWLSNPRLGQNDAMKYCVVYDVFNSCSEGTIEDDKVTCAIPCGLFEFQGGCTFTKDGRFVLINDQLVSIYSIQQQQQKTMNSGENTSLFQIEFTVNMQTMSLEKKDDTTVPAYDFFPVVLDKDNKKEANLVVSHQSVTRTTKDIENFDDIFFEDESESELPSDLEEEDNMVEEVNNDDDVYRVTEFINRWTPNEEEVINTDDTYELFVKNNLFIRTNIEKIRCHNVIYGSMMNQFYTWCLHDRKVIFSLKKIIEDIDYLTAFTQQKNFVAISQKRTPLNDTDLVEKPICKVYDCHSGVTIAELTLPKKRTRVGVSQVLFIQHDMYVLAVSHNSLETFFDLWDVYSSTHLDTYSFRKDVHCIEHSQFILDNISPLTSGCGRYIKIDLHDHSNKGSTIFQSKTFNLSIHPLEFFKEASHYNNTCHCGHTMFKSVEQNIDSNRVKTKLFTYNWWTNKNTLSVDTKPPSTRVRKEMLKSYTGKFTKDEPFEFLFFLDKECTHAIMCHSPFPNCSGDMLVLMVWQITVNHQNELYCRKKDDNHDLSIRLKKLKYSFVLERENFLCKNEGVLGHSAMFLDMNALKQYCVQRLAASIYCVDHNTSPVLLMQMNHRTKKDAVLGYFVDLTKEKTSKDDEKEFTVAVPLHQYASIEHYLNILANQVLITVPHTSRQPIQSEHIYQIFNKFIIDDVDRENQTTEYFVLSDLIANNTGYFSTLGGYAMLCQLARNDRYNDVLCQILKNTTKVNYCTIANNHGYLTDPLQEAINNKAVKNAQVIYDHLLYSVSTYGTEYGHLLLKHSQLANQLS